MPHGLLKESFATTVISSKVFRFFQTISRLISRQRPVQRSLTRQQTPRISQYHFLLVGGLAFLNIPVLVPGNNGEIQNPTQRILSGNPQNGILRRCTGLYISIRQ